jgi:hypothetical protein
MVLASLLGIGVVGVSYIGQPPRVAHAESDHPGPGDGGAGSSGTAANNDGAPGQGPGNHDGSQGTPFAWLIVPHGVQLT